MKIQAKQRLSAGKISEAKATSVFQALQEAIAKVSSKPLAWSGPRKYSMSPGFFCQTQKMDGLDTKGLDNLLKGKQFKTHDDHHQMYWEKRVGSSTVRVTLVLPNEGLVLSVY